MLLVIDNYDSFTFNIVRYFRELGDEVRVLKNDEMAIEEIEDLKPKRIVLSPGPKDPLSAGISVAVIQRFTGEIPILGVCLGHQCIAHAFGADVVRAKHVMHGKTSSVFHRGEGLYRGIPTPFVATRYHSLVVDADTLPNTLIVDAWTQNEAGAVQEIMGMRHRDWPVFGVQFHPESILSEYGHPILKNFLAI